MSAYSAPLTSSNRCLISRALRRYKYIPRHESSLRSFSIEEQLRVCERVETLCCFSALPDLSDLWDTIWESYAQTDASFTHRRSTTSERIRHLRKRGVHGGAFKLENGKYAIAVRSLRQMAILRHELQHVIDDADAKEYVDDPIYFEHRATWVEHQNETATQSDVELLYS